MYKILQRLKIKQKYYKQTLTKQINKIKQIMKILKYCSFEHSSACLVNVLLQVYCRFAIVAISNKVHPEILKCKSTAVISEQRFVAWKASFYIARRQWWKCICRDAYALSTDTFNIRGLVLNSAERGEICTYDVKKVQICTKNMP